MPSIRKYTFATCLFCSLSCSTDAERDVITDANGNEITVDVSANKKPVGDSAMDFLAETHYKSLRAEIFYVAGLKPTSNTIAGFEDFLSDRLHKPGGISVALYEIPSPGKSQYTVSDIRALEDELRTAYNQGDEMAVFGIYIDGAYSENSEDGSVLGIAYRNTSFVIFEETIRSFSGQPLAPSTTVLETAVLDHEFGHLLGLVNTGSPPQSDHQDMPHGSHCTDENCLMYWTAETGEGLVNMISGGMVPSLDDQCLADLAVMGGKP